MRRLLAALPLLLAGGIGAVGGALWAALRAGFRLGRDSTDDYMDGAARRWRRDP